MLFAGLRVVSVLVGRVAVPSCAEEPLPIPRSVADEGDRDAIREALLVQMHREAVSQLPEIGATCVTTENGGEPSLRLLARLSGRNLGLKRRSQCVGRDRIFVDAISGARAVYLNARSLEVTEPGKARAEGMYSLGVLWCGGGTYGLEFRLGRWAVVDGPRDLFMC